MRKIYNIMMLLAGLTFFQACDTDIDHPTALTPDTFVLNSPPYVSGIYDLINTESVLLTCSQPDYGFTAATTYRVQVALDNSFENFVTLPTFYNSAKMEVDASEIAVAMVNLLGITDEADFPTGELFSVYIRLSAELSDGSRQVLSNAIELPQVKSYFALQPMVMPENIYLIGNVVGWNWDAATQMVPVWGTEGKFWVMQYLGKTDGNNAEIKFNTAKAWDGNDFGMKTADIDDASGTLAGISGDDNIVIGNPGWYIVVVTTEISGRDYIYHVQFLEPKVYLFGRVWSEAGIFSAGDDNLFTVPDISLGADADFVSPAFARSVSTDEDGVRACVVISGEDWWHTEFMVFDGKLEYRGTGGDQTRVSGNAGQKLYINFTKGTGKIE
ncbi:MAG: SusF/SusE family outer membrane protein [Candidatus Azobacteroides sp.]|nr:SusF/SusE family outer membrane protein [Candidatus Azobacteroides sp.]